MKSLKLYTILAACLLFGRATLADTESIDKELSGLATNLVGQLKAHSKKKVAVLDFTDLQGHQSELGRYIAEMLTVEIVMQKREFTVLDRANLKRVMTEQKLTAEGLVDPENAKRLGMFTGVDAFVLGNIIPSKLNVQVTAKVITTETAEILGASKAMFRRDETVDQLLQIKALVEPETEHSPEGKTNAVVVVSNSSTNAATTNQIVKVPPAVQTNAPSMTVDDKFAVIKPRDNVGIGLSLSIINGGQYFLSLFLTNQNAGESVWLAFNCGAFVGIPKIMLTDSDNYEIEPYPNGLSAIGFSCLNDSRFWSATELRPGDNIVATCKFNANDRKPAKPGKCRVQFELLIGDRFQDGQARGRLHNIVTDIRAS